MNKKITNIYMMAKNMTDWDSIIGDEFVSLLNEFYETEKGIINVFFQCNKNDFKAKEQISCFLGKVKKNCKEDKLNYFINNENSIIPSLQKIIYGIKECKNIHFTSLENGRMSPIISSGNNIFVFGNSLKEYTETLSDFLKKKENPQDSTQFIAEINVSNINELFDLSSSDFDEIAAYLCNIEQKNKKHITIVLKSEDDSQLFRNTGMRFYNILIQQIYLKNLNQKDKIPFCIRYMELNKKLYDGYVELDVRCLEEEIQKKCDRKTIELSNLLNPSNLNRKKK